MIESTGVIQIRDKIIKREITSVEVVKALINNIEKFNDRYNAIVTMDKEDILNQAKKMDKVLLEGNDPGLLHGIPFTIKDMYRTKNIRTTNGCIKLKNFIPEEDADVVTRLKKAGAIILGKTNLPKMGMDTQTENKLFRRTLNPWNIAYTPGGSSGGEAAAIASGMSLAGIGSDVGGSLRIPAHYCGVCSIKPTEGMVSNEGLMLPGKVNTLLHMVGTGPMARNPEDLKLILEVISNNTKKFKEPENMISSNADKELKIGWIDGFNNLDVENSYRKLINNFINILNSNHIKTENSFPNIELKSLWNTYGQLFGMMALSELPWIIRKVISTLSFTFKDEISRSFAKGATSAVLDYFKIIELRKEFITILDNYFDNYDALIMPVTSSPAVLHRKSMKIHTPINVNKKNIPGNIAVTGFTSIFNLTGHPVVTIPIGLSHDGLPLGIQIISRLGDDYRLLDISSKLFKFTNGFQLAQN
ncbi:MAG: amidase [Deltaproteobacteria bacterium]|nr:amidase [Deltaproteobacteria bacterium]